ncbi:MAG: hypothetical protein AAF581_10030 [Planctomycetota bacterium]
MKRILLFALCSALCSVLCVGAGCDSHDHADHGHSHDGEDGHGHHHVAPHGGTLVVLGDEFAHLEFLLEEKTGKLRMYALGAHAEKGVPLNHGELPLQIKTAAATLEVRLEGVASQLTGESRDNTSVFQATAAGLIGVAEFEVTIPRIKIRGTEFTGVSFSFPEGNE